MKRLKNHKLILCLGLLFPAINAHAIESVHDDTFERLKGLSLEDLMEVEVTSVSRKKQKLADSAAAVYVITQEDIRRSGHQSIPEILRMAPGIQVAQIDSSKWAISSRGLNGRFANKLLVLMDGRTIYSPLYSGVYWDVQDMVLEDIERIEVIRGPGATLWGANAVNGVINIISKSTRDTQAGLATLAVGKNEKYSTSLRYGGSMSPDTTYRIYAKGFERQGGEYFENSLAGDSEVADEWKNRRVGFKLESDLTLQDSITLQGDWYNGDSEQNAYIQVSPFSSVIEQHKAKTHGNNLMVDWKHRWSENLGMQFKAYYDYTFRKNRTLEESRKTLDLDFQSDYRINQQEIIWGIGYRYIKDDMQKPIGSVLEFEPEEQNLKVFSAFIQDEIAFNDHTMHLILGSKFEHNEYTGNEWQPNIRFLWNPDAQSSVWTSVARAVRTPSRIERDVVIKPGGPVVTYGSDAFESEELLAYEIGYRVYPSTAISIDLALFSNHYDGLRTLEQDNAQIPSFRYEFDNKMEGKTYGMELSIQWDINSDWRINTSYSWLKADFDLDDDSVDTNSIEKVHNSPEHQFHLRSYYNISATWELDSAVYYVSELPSSDVGSYTRLDLRLGWHPRKNLEVSFGVQNLLDKQHPEFVEFPGFSFSGPQGLFATQVERNIYCRLSLKL